MAEQRQRLTLAEVLDDLDEPVTVSSDDEDVLWEEGKICKNYYSAIQY